MRARREFRKRKDIDVAVLDALVDRASEGMTVYELRAAVDADIDAIGEALDRLKADDLITAEGDDDRVRIMPADRVVPDPGETPDDDRGLLDKIRDRLGF
jgi:DNA-binding transcriptional ArsR family regulator